MKTLKLFAVVAYMSGSGWVARKTDFNIKDLKSASDCFPIKTRGGNLKIPTNLKIDECNIESIVKRNAIQILLFCSLWLNFVFWYRNPIIKKQTTSVLSLPIHVLWFIWKAYLSLFSSIRCSIKFYFSPPCMASTLKFSPPPLLAINVNENEINDEFIAKTFSFNLKVC